MASGKRFLPFAAYNADFHVFTFLSLTYAVFSSFLTKNGSLPVYSLSRYFACLQQITLILATSYSQQHFCFLDAKLLSFQLYRTENVFSLGCCLCCF